MTTTLNAIRQNLPCKDSWEKLLASLGKTKADDEQIELRCILDTLGVYDAIWALRSLEGKDRDIRLFACECAESVLHLFEEKYPDDNRPRKAIEASRKYANGEATIEEVKAALEASDDAGDAGAAWAAKAAWAAAWADSDAAARDARDAARSARDAEREKQRQLFIKYFCQ